MKLSKTSFYSTLLLVVLLSQIYIPSFKFNIFFQLGALLLYFKLEKVAVSKDFLKVSSPIFLIFLLGLLGFILFLNPIKFALKDIFHFIKPIQGLLIGYFFYKTINNKNVFIKTILVTAFISAIIHFIIVLFFTNLNDGTVSAIRTFTKDNFLELIALFFLGYYKTFFGESLFKSKITFYVFFIVILASCMLYLSRTMMVGALVFYFSIKGYTKITAKSLSILTSAILGILVLYGYLYSVKIERGKPGLEAFLYKVKIAPEELFKTKIDRENHEDLWDHWRGYEAKRAFALMNSKPISYISGTGYGSLVNLKFKAPLGKPGEDGIKFISELHNGYPYVLYKTGVFGLLLYLSFLFNLYKKINYLFNFETVFISALGLFYFFTTLTITGIYNTQDTTIFILGGLLFSATSLSKKLKV